MEKRIIDRTSEFEGEPTLIELISKDCEIMNSKKFIIAAEYNSKTLLSGCGGFEFVAENMLLLIKNTLEHINDDDLKRATALGTIELIMDVAELDFEDLLKIMLVRKLRKEN